MGRKRKALFTPKKAKADKAKRSKESSSEKKRGQEKIRLSTAANRLQQSPHDKASRLKNVRLSMAANRQNESPVEKASRLKNDRLTKAAYRQNESPDDKKSRLKNVRHSMAASRKLIYLKQRHDILNDKCSLDDGHVDDLSSDEENVDFTSAPSTTCATDNSTTASSATDNSTTASSTTCATSDTPAVPDSPVTPTMSCTSSIVSPINNTPSSVSNTTEHFIGPMTNKCPHCQAARFPNEALICCHNGKVMLPVTDYPQELQQLFENQAFLKDIRIYNNIFAFASLGAQISPPPGFGPYCFRIHGQIYHRSGTLHPQDGDLRKFGQVYILDGAEALELRAKQAPLLSRPIIAAIQGYLNANNPYASTYKHMSEVEQAENSRAAAAGEPPKTVKMVFQEKGDARRYNAPTDEVAAVFVGNDGAPPGNHDIVVYPKDKPLRNISYLNKHCDPMMYPLLFPNGQLGWDLTEPHNPSYATSSRKTVTQLQYYSHRLAIRSHQFSAIHRSGKLMQQYVVDAYVKTEAARLSFYANHQSQLRVECYQGLMDHVQSQAAALNATVGRIVILPSSYTGSPRNMQQEYQDAMAIVSSKGKPDAFLTMTCNPKWKEIQDNLLPGQNASDRPDLVSRVFKHKLQELQIDLSDREIIGKVVAKIHVIEYQKRGLPHAHILIWFANSDKLRTEEDIDRLISAEIPDPVTQPQLYKIVKETMIHGPCGIVDGKVFNRTCQSSGSCTKNFPKSFSANTSTCVDGYPVYRRRNDGRFVETRGVKLDNRWVVPYCAVLSLKYQCHINLEACMSIKSVKYLFKYVYKGHDCINLELSEGNHVYNHDEIRMYLDARYVSAPEAFWRLSEYEMHGKSHTIIRLPVHLPDFQNVYFRPGMAEEALARSHGTQLTAWFDLNKDEDDPSSNQYLYVDIPLHYVFIKKTKKWKKRQRGGEKVIPRMYSVSPIDREKFALRCLLLHVEGATSFEYLRTHNDIVHGTFQEACIARGLLEDDQEWDRALRDAVTLMMPRQCRQLFVTILTHCQPSEPGVLWERYKESLSEDFAQNQSTEVATECALADIEKRLSEFGMSCVDRGLPAPDLNIVVSVDPSNPVDDAAIASHNMSILNDDQTNIVTEIMNHVMHPDNSRHNLHYLDGPAGTGKTMVYNTLVSLLKSKNIPVAACAWTGIASILLRDGVTVHNLFKLPVPVLDTSSCKISPTYPYAEYIRSLSLILIDEASMIPNEATHAIDRVLRDIMNNHIPFGGKLVIFGGDFRQVLPVVVRGTATMILEKCLKRSPLWPLFKTHKLTKNMRALAEEREFSKWLLKVGDGTLTSSSGDANMIDAPPDCLVKNMVDAIFPDFTVDRKNSVILTPKNDTSLKLNDEILQRLSGVETEYFSCDKALCDDEGEAQNYPIEFLHSITPTGMPPHRLGLKAGCTVMLLRNLCSKRGLCNGVRLKVVSLHNAVLHCEILTGSHLGHQVLIPKLKLAPSDANLPFVLQRIQFPVRLAYSMTINKSQGQTFDNVGIFLPEPVFSHGQLYVAFSRARSLHGVKIKIGNSDDGKEQVMKNVVYKDIL